MPSVNCQSSVSKPLRVAESPEPVPESPPKPPDWPYPPAPPEPSPIGEPPPQSPLQNLFGEKFIRS